MNRDLKNKITKQDNLIKEKVNTVYISKSISPITFANYTRYINNRYDRLRKLISNFILANYKKYYIDERWKQIIIAKRLNRNLRSKQFQKDIDTLLVLPYIQGILNDINTAIENGRRERYLTTRLIELRNKQQAQIRAFLEENEIQDIINDVASYPDARNTLIERLKDYSDDNKKVVVETKTGKTLHYDVKYYADMVLRTTFREIQTQGTLKAANDVGSDLVQVSIHNTVCPICIPYEGRIYSVSGVNPMFPPLEDSPPFHPNCQHSISVTFSEYLERKGWLQEYSDFSNGKTESPPGIKHWTPVAEREVI